MERKNPRKRAKNSTIIRSKTMETALISDPSSASPGIRFVSMSEATGVFIPVNNPKGFAISPPVTVSKKYNTTQAIGADIILNNPISFDLASIPVRQKAIATSTISTCMRRGLVFAPKIPKTMAIITGPRTPPIKACQRGKLLTIRKSSESGSNIVFTYLK
jgi:hypothetical protein